MVSWTTLLCCSWRVLCVADMAPERNALMQHVYPQLKEFCRKEYRLEFQVYTLKFSVGQFGLARSYICRRGLDIPSVFVSALLLGDRKDIRSIKIAPTIKGSSLEDLWATRPNLE